MSAERMTRRRLRALAYVIASALLARQAPSWSTVGHAHAAGLALGLLWHLRETRE